MTMIDFLINYQGFRENTSMASYQKDLIDRSVLVYRRNVWLRVKDNTPGGDARWSGAWRDPAAFNDLEELEIAVTYQSLRPLEPPR